MTDGLRAYREQAELERLNRDLPDVEEAYQARKLDGLRARDEAEDALSAELQRRGASSFWELPEARQWQLLDLLAQLRSYPQAVERFLDDSTTERFFRRAYCAQCGEETEQVSRPGAGWLCRSTPGRAPTHSAEGPGGPR